MIPVEGRGSKSLRRSSPNATLVFPLPTSQSSQASPPEKEMGIWYSQACLFKAVPSPEFPEEAEPCDLVSSSQHLLTPFLSSRESLSWRANLMAKGHLMASGKTWKEASREVQTSHLWGSHNSGFLTVWPLSPTLGLQSVHYSVVSPSVRTDLI